MYCHSITFLSSPVLPCLNPPAALDVFQNEKVYLITEKWIVRSLTNDLSTYFKAPGKEK